MPTSHCIPQFRGNRFNIGPLEGRGLLLARDLKLCARIGQVDPMELIHALLYRKVTGSRSCATVDERFHNARAIDESIRRTLASASGLDAASSHSVRESRTRGTSIRVVSNASVRDICSSHDSDSDLSYLPSPAGRTAQYVRGPTLPTPEPVAAPATKRGFRRVRLRRTPRLPPRRDRIEYPRARIRLDPAARRRGTISLCPSVSLQNFDGFDAEQLRSSARSQAF